MSKLRLVLDTNVLVSAVLMPRSAPARAVRYTFAHGQVLVSADTVDEITNVLRRPRFDRYIDEDDRTAFLAEIIREALPVVITERMAVCRDPKDDKFLDLAVSGQATHIISGDSDLLALHPFRGISILTPQDFLALP